jgi:4'-phosphopantetheinyl transferase
MTGVSSSGMGSCEVWWAPADCAGQLSHLLPAADLDRAAGFSLQADRDRSLTAAALVRLLLASRLGVEPTEVAIDRTCGKPRLAWPAAGPGFSVSHAGEQVVVAISDDAAVGVDVERLGRMDDCCTMTWVRKEAVIKAAGTGLATPMSSFAVSRPAEPPRLLTWPADPARTAACALADLPAADGYLAALAMFGTGLTVTTHDGSTLLTEHAAIRS